MQQMKYKPVAIEESGFESDSSISAENDFSDDKKYLHIKACLQQICQEIYSAKYTNYFMYIGYCKEKEKLIGGETFSQIYM